MWNHWHGFIGGPAVGSLSTTFQGSGTGVSSYGNCHSGGKVRVFLNEKQISEAMPLQNKVISFVYSVGDVLRIGEYETAIWKLYSLVVKCK